MTDIHSREEKASYPAGWQQRRLKLLVSRFFSGGTPSTSQQDYWGGDIPWVSPKDMKSSSISFSADKITELALADNNLPLLDPGHVLMVVRPGILRHSIPIAVNSLPVSINQDIKAIRLCSKIDPFYFRYFVDGLQSHLLNLWRKPGTTVESLEYDYYSEHLVPIPPRNIQRRIARVLDEKTARIDGLIEKKRALLDRLAEKRQALITRAVTKGLNSDAPMKPSGIDWLGEIPAHWDCCGLGQKIKLQRGVDITKDKRIEGPFPVISSGGIDYFHDTALCAGPGVLVGRKGSAGKLHYVETDFWPHDTTLYVREFRGNEPKFVWYLLHTLDLTSFDTGSSNPTVNRNRIHPMKTAWPSPREQAVIASQLDIELESTGNIGIKIGFSIQKLEEYRSALITAAVTGQIAELR
ncbi:restriction modification system DNA specificity domain protein [Thiorhodococcus drewsii AZ1]|uniref:Restriction modification system DNA specificity domain protein n=1 Tax=Thiorhodococcus drewsii AZ1 TaxID=765913 RepID=G2E1E3_9GAMM|nr:restriction endonuclease subunit S [Thiorhodococcus drewsii]EGV31240.1 restriction modification system DNA specificity domain protein [Thiorhodococcus drewsii AZ1]